MDSKWSCIYLQKCSQLFHSSRGSKNLWTLQNPKAWWNGWCFLFHQTSFQHLRRRLISSLWAHSLPAKCTLWKSEQPRQQVSSHIMGNRLGTLQEMTRIASMFFLRPEILKRLNRTMSTQIFVVTMLTPLAYFWGLPPSRYRWHVENKHVGCLKNGVKKKTNCHFKRKRMIGQWL